VVDALELFRTRDKIAVIKPERFLADADQSGGMHRHEST